MYNIPFRLFKFCYLDDKAEEAIMYIISTDWSSAFNEIYCALDNTNLNIVSVELLAHEYINMIIDNRYTLTKLPNGRIDPDDYNIIKGIIKNPSVNK